MENKISSNNIHSNFSEWYNTVIKESGLIEYSSARGCVILKPYGYAIWENIQTILNAKIKETGHENVYFPMFIPKSFFSREGEHVKGFAKECAIVTHSRLKLQDGEIITDPSSKLEEEYIVRPTSETVIWNSFHEWVHSYRDLPLKINQWCNVCRWEMRTRPFLRTSEFLWQEGHTAHSNREEAYEETLKMLNIYNSFGKEYLAIPFIRGRKTEIEKFAGAEITFTLEALMQDGKALQCGTAHLLGQNFSQAFDVRFLDKNNIQQLAWGTSWGVSTRLIGALIMTHGDERGLVLPPKIAPIQIVIIPIFKGEEELKAIINFLKNSLLKLEKKGIKYKIDTREEYRPGYKFNEWEIKGVPIQIRIGLKDIESKNCEVFRRDNCSKNIIEINSLNPYLEELLNTIQENIYNKALKFREDHTSQCDDYENFKNKIKNKEGFVIYKYLPEEEEKISNETTASVRCQPIDEKGTVIDPTTAFFAQNY